MNTQRLGLAARVAGGGLVLGHVLVPGRVPAQPAACGIRLVHPPVDVGPLIDSRVAALGACAHQLDVWIVRTPDGLYLVAQDSLGRIRERLVPDAEVAAALIASWVENVNAILPPGPHAPPAPTAPPMPSYLAAATLRRGSCRRRPSSAVASPTTVPTTTPPAARTNVTSGRWSSREPRAPSPSARTSGHRGQRYRHRCVNGSLKTS